MSDGGETVPPRSRRPIGELHVSSGADAGLTIAVADDVVLGRDNQADIVLKDPSGKLSRRHARIHLQDGVPVLEDLGSTNGTFLNGKRITEPRRLSAGDRIQIGESTLEFVPTPEPATAPQPQATRVRGVVPVTFAPAGADGELRILNGPESRRGSLRPRGQRHHRPRAGVRPAVARQRGLAPAREGDHSRRRRDDRGSAFGKRHLRQRRAHPRELCLAPGDRIEIGSATIELTSPVFEGTAVRPQPIQVTAVRDVPAVPRSCWRRAAASGGRSGWC